MKPIVNSIIQPRLEQQKWNSQESEYKVRRNKFFLWGGGGGRIQALKTASGLHALAHAVLEYTHSVSLHVGATAFSQSLVQFLHWLQNQPCSICSQSRR